VNRITAELLRPRQRDFRETLSNLRHPWPPALPKKSATITQNPLFEPFLHASLLFLILRNTGKSVQSLCP
jgi:hypothetical protein